MILFAKASPDFAFVSNWSYNFSLGRDFDDFPGLLN